MYNSEPGFFDKIKSKLKGLTSSFSKDESKFVGGYKPYSAPGTNSYSSVGGKKRTLSKTRPGRFNFTTKKGSKVFHQMGHYVRKMHAPYTRRYKKGSRSKTHSGRLDFTTKKGSKVYHRKGHYVRKNKSPYTAAWYKNLF
jgi:hypothetical protein